MNREDVIILFPFRFAVCGPMNSGKTYFIYSLIKNLKKLTNISDLQQKVHVHFCYNLENSSNAIREAAQSSGVVSHFYSQYRLPNFDVKFNMMLLLNRFF